MTLTQQHLAPLLSSITSLLGSVPDQLEPFERWAHRQALRLKSSAEKGSANLALESNLLRDELVLMTPRAGFETMFTERTERIRTCQRIWLTGLIDFVDDLLDVPVAESARAFSAAHHDLKRGVGAERGLVEVSEALTGQQPHRLERVVERRS